MGGQSGTEAPQGAERTFLPLLSYRRKNRGFLRSKRRRVNISGGGWGADPCSRSGKDSGCPGQNRKYRETRNSLFGIISSCFHDHSRARGKRHTEESSLEAHKYPWREKWEGRYYLQKTGPAYPAPPCKDPKSNEIGDTVLTFQMGKPSRRLQSSDSSSHTKRQRTR